VHRHLEPLKNAPDRRFQPPRGGVVTAAQKKMHSKLERSGFEVFIVRSLAEFIEELEEHGTAPPEGDEEEAEEDAPPLPPLPPAARTPPRTPPRTQPAGRDRVHIDCTSDGEEAQGDGEEEAQRAQGDGEEEAQRAQRRRRSRPQRARRRARSRQAATRSSNARATARRRRSARSPCGKAACGCPSRGRRRLRTARAASAEPHLGEARAPRAL
jgi:hypothetical protein